MKCNDYKLVLETFASMGAGFDCASKEEIRTILDLGIHPDKIIFANPARIIDHIEYAAKVGVTALTFDSEEELHKIKKHHPKAELLIRIRCDDVSARYKLGRKFGVLPQEESWHLLNVAKSLDLNLVGVAFHVGSGCENYAIYFKAIAAARKVFDMGDELGYTFNILDIGGGYPGNSNEPLNQIADYINDGLKQFFPDETVRIIAEPGKYAVNTAFHLVTQIHSKRIVHAKKDHIKMYYIDTGLYNSTMCTLFGEYYSYRPINMKNKEEELYPSIIWGPTQESIDRITETYCYLPDLKIGDWLICDEAGAYTLALICGYQGYPKPSVYAVINKEDWRLLTEVVEKPLSKERFVTDSSMEMFLRDVPLSTYIASTS